ncbi:MAG: NAD(P)H-quinone oxidoreductase subunit J, chloroplastic [Bacteroidia bacterium]|nr:NAD(P)H-quinone oxidoreductase subunit J, chloroplastic [Bacteroidia bacterium]
MEDTLLQTIHGKLKSKFGEDIISAEQAYDFPVYTVSKKKIIEIISFLYNEEELDFRFLTTMCGLQFPDNKGGEFCIMYQLHNMPENWRIRLKVYTPANDMEYPTLTGIFSTANWMEREAFDFYGFIFKGHPNLIRILNMEDMTYHPMRKEYPLEDGTREDKNDTMFGR